MSNDEIKISKSGWTLKNIKFGNFATLVYRGIKFRPGQHLFVVTGRGIVYTRPDIVPEGVKRKIDKILLGE